MFEPFLVFSNPFESTCQLSRNGICFVKSVAEQRRDAIGTRKWEVADRSARSRTARSFTLQVAVRHAQRASRREARVRARVSGGLQPETRLRTC